MGKRALDKAKQNKFDEFYTQLTDIEKELKHYENHFEGKVVYCNCDTDKSNFVKYFTDNFDRLKLKKLLYSGYPETDFRSPESIELLKQSDIVVTNPPFSLFREYVAQLVEYDKKFLIIGSINAVAYKDIFPLIRNNKLWLGVSIHGGDIEFNVPKDYPLYAAGHRVEDDGEKYIRVTSVRWYTNLSSDVENPFIELTKKYNELDHPKYDNYDVINVDKTKDIPIDYDGYMGVPITFLDKYNPEQFEILGKIGDGEINGKIKYNRIVVKNKRIAYE